MIGRSNNFVYKFKVKNVGRYVKTVDPVKIV